MADWYPVATRDSFKDGGSFTGGPPKGLLHTTEGSTYAGARSVYASKSVAPHFTASFETGAFKVWQHVPISIASRALQNKSGGVQTNRDHVIQIEIVGRAADPRPYVGAFLDGLRKLMRWIEANAGVPRTCGVVFKPYPESYGNNGVRLSGPAWDNYSGWLGHMHAAENSHGDPGAIPIAALLDSGSGGGTDVGELGGTPKGNEQAQLLTWAHGDIGGLRNVLYKPGYDPNQVPSVLEYLGQILAKVESLESRMTALEAKP